MRAMVLAAGLGTRFRPLSDVLPKPAAPILGEPLVRRTLRHLGTMGVEAATVNLHHRPDDVIAACAELRAPRVRFQREPVILGTGGALAKAAPWLFAKAGEPVVVANGDMIFDLDLAPVLAFHRRTGALATMVLRERDEERYGKVELGAGDRIVRLLGEPASRRPGRAFMFTGVHVLSPAFAPLLRAEPSCVVRTAYRALVDAGANVRGFVTRTPWLDIGTPEDYLRANLELLGERVVVARGARVAASARLRRAYVGEGAVVGEGAKLEGCVLWRGARVEPAEHVAGCVVTPARAPH